MSAGQVCPLCTEYGWASGGLLWEFGTVLLASGVCNCVWFGFLGFEDEVGQFCSHLDIVMLICCALIHPLGKDHHLCENHMFRSAGMKLGATVALGFLEVILTSPGLISSEKVIF